MKRTCLAIALCTAAWLVGSPPSYAGSLADVSALVAEYASIGDISDPEVLASLYDTLSKAQAATDPDAEAGYRESFISTVNAYAGSGISSAAAAGLVAVATP